MDILPLVVALASLATVSSVGNYRVAIVEQPPFIERVGSGYRGYCIDLIQKISDIVGFDYELYPVRDRSYGRLNDRGEWNGLIAELIRGEADIALGALEVMPAREMFIDFTVPFYDLVGQTLLMKRPRQGAYSQPIRGLEDLMKQDRIRFAPVRGTAAEAYLRGMAQMEQKLADVAGAVASNRSAPLMERSMAAAYPAPTFWRDVYRRAQASGMPNSTEEGIQRARTSDFALIVDAIEGKYAELTACDLVTVGEEFFRHPLAIAVQQGSPLKDQISSAILKLLNQRDLEALKQQWWNQNPNRVNCPRRG